ncbi:MAG: glycosyltransferase family 4 protein [Proteobacteria bacterium]|nr:glycosyltransferase family 4 protein [Pseudomonadota bacterium]MBU1710326.1 glycosyltransferase family 4 protein [Pseudomonadota bacterium]
MNIFILSSAIEMYSFQLANGLAEKDNVMIGMRKSEGLKLFSQFQPFISASKVTSYLTPHYAFPDPRCFWEGLKLYREIIHHDSHVLHFHSGNLFAEYLIALFLAHRKKIPIITTFHDTSNHSGEQRKLRHKYISSNLIMHVTDHAIVHGKVLADDGVNFGFDRSLITVVPHGNYDIYHHTANPAEESQPVPGRVLLFGRMIRYKGLEILIKAAPVIASRVPNLKIVLAGTGPELNRLLPEVENNPLFEVHNRFIDSGEVKTFFSRASVIVLPYHDATQSGPLHLAYTFGRPVVASKVGAIPEALTDGIEGILVPPDNPEALAQGLTRILLDPQTAMDMGLNGREKASTRLNWAGPIAEQTRKAYAKAVDHHENRKKYLRPSLLKMLLKKYTSNN